MAAYFIRRLRHDCRYVNGTTVAIHGNEGEITRVRVTASAGQQLFRLDANPYFHRGPTDVIDARLHDD
jgi:hypothetical protein